jgi:beta-glucuronidase
VGWYEGSPESADSIQWKSTWDKPVIVSEFGVRCAVRIPNVAGLTPWVLMDFRSPTRMLLAIQDYHNRKGLISNRGERKLAFYELQGFYRKLTDSRPPQNH